MCLKLAISICLLLKYFANNKVRDILAKSTGWKAKAPRSNQLRAPLKTDPATNKNNKVIEINKNIMETVLLLLKNLQSMVLERDMTKKPTESQMICLKNKLSFVVFNTWIEVSEIKEFKVKRPAIDIKKMTPNNTQSTDK